MPSPYQDTPFVNGYEFTQGSGYSLPHYPFEPPPELRDGVVGEHAVVIVGAGLSGLTLACALAQLGVPAVLLDEDNTVGVKGASSRGICYTQKSLEIFERLGIYDAIAAKGVQWSIGRTFAGDDEVYAFDLSQQNAYRLSAQPPFINLQQFYIEAFLVERIAQLGQVSLRWQNRVTAFHDQADGALLEVDTPAGAYRLRARHVIDASGAHSPFRQWCQARVESLRGDDRWCIADVRFALHPPVERHTWVQAPFNEDRAVWQHLMADDVWRIDYQMAPDADPEWVSQEAQVRARLARQFGPQTEVEIVWVGPYAYKSECIDRMRIGRVFFMGDAAKVVSPFGARGGNTGIGDADNLAWKLAAVLRGQAAARLLDSYHEERHEAAQENVRVTRRTARFLRAPEGMERVFRQAAIALAKQHGFARPLVNTGRMAVANSYHFSSACVTVSESLGGVSLQNVGFSWHTGTARRGRAAGVVNDLLRWADGRLLLLAFGPLGPRACSQIRSLSRVAALRAVQVLAPGQAAQAEEHVVDVSPLGAGRLAQACGLTGGSGWALVRPDSYIAATGGRWNGAVVRAVQAALGL